MLSLFLQPQMGTSRAIHRTYFLRNRYRSRRYSFEVVGVVLILGLVTCFRLLVEEELVTAGVVGVE